MTSTANPSGATSGGKPIQQVIRELVQLVRDYAKQETVDPLKGIGRFLAFGVLASLLTAVGVVLLTLALLRLLQTEAEDTFDGFWSWAPYFITMLVALAVAGFAASRIKAGKGRERGRRA